MPHYWNNDGIDLGGSRNVIVSDCRINAADDGICLKSESTAACESIAVSNCTVRTSASAFKCGTDSNQGFRNISVHNLVVYDNARSGIALEAVDGGVLEHIVISDVTMHNVGNAIFLRLGDRSRKNLAGPTVGALRDVRIANVFATVTGDDSDAGYPLRAPRNPEPRNLEPVIIAGLPGYPVRNVTLTDVNIRYAGGAQRSRAHVALDALDKVPERADRYPEYDMFGELPAWGFYCRHVEGLLLSNVVVSAIKPDFRPALVCEEVGQLTLTGFHPQTAGEGPLLVLHNVRGAVIRACTAPAKTGVFLRQQGNSRDVMLGENDLRQARQPLEHAAPAPAGGAARQVLWGKKTPSDSEIVDG